MTAVDNPRLATAEPDTVREPGSPVWFEDPPEFVEQWLRQRRELGQDGLDEVWEGVYRVVSGPARVHGDLDDQVAVVLYPLIRAAGLWGTGQVNIGSNHHDFRVPDRTAMHDRRNLLWNPTAAIVVEILSPRDRSREKFDFYRRHGVEEMLLVDPLGRRVEWHVATGDGFARAGRSALLGITEEELVAAIDWLPIET